MIRKWSYINNYLFTNLNLTEQWLRSVKLISIYKFKVFKKSIKFRKFNKGITRMVRRKYIKYRRLTSNVSLLYSIHAWSLAISKQRHFTRFFQAINLFKWNIFSPNPLVFFKFLNKLNNSGINAPQIPLISSSSKNIINHLLQITKVSRFWTSGRNFKNTSWTFLQFYNDLNLEVYKPLGLNVVNYAPNLYPVSILTYKPYLYKNYTYSQLYETLFKVILRYILEKYKFLVKLTLLNSFKK